MVDGELGEVFFRGFCGTRYQVELVLHILRCHLDLGVLLGVGKEVWLGELGEVVALVLSATRCSWCCAAWRPARYPNACHGGKAGLRERCASLMGRQSIAGAVHPW